MKIIVTGAGGMLGHEVVHSFECAGCEVIATDVIKDYTRLDITDPADIGRMLQAQRPAWLINCAAYTRVDDCETEIETAEVLNAQAPAHLAAACAARGVRLLHIGTDYVFDGQSDEPYREEDVPNPQSVYGKTKLAGEQAVIAAGDANLVVRTQWLFGQHGPNFVATILGLARERERLQVVNDQWGAPTYARDLAKALKLLVDADAHGIYHVCNRGIATWYDLASKAVELMELGTEVVPVGTEQFPRPAPRPRNSSLSTRKFTATTGKLMPPWQISLQDYLRYYLQQSRQETRQG